MYFDYYYMVLVVPAILLSLLASAHVKQTYAKYACVFAQSGVTAAEVARRILDANGLHGIRIERIDGSLTDHYDPKAGVIRLSDSVYRDASCASIGVAAHEAGHAVQHATAYMPIRLRNFVLPLAQLGSAVSWPLVLLGLFLGMSGLVQAGILLFSCVLAFQIVTLPVEFNASRRAVIVLKNEGILTGETLLGAKKVLFAAAMTYVSGALTTAMQLLRLILLSRRDD